MPIPCSGHHMYWLEMAAANELPYFCATQANCCRPHTVERTLTDNSLLHYPQPPIVAAHVPVAALGIDDGLADADVLRG